MRRLNMAELLRSGSGEEQNAVRRLVRGEGFCAARPNIVFEGKTFCFTGCSKRATREALADLVGRLGGAVSERVTRGTDFLVVGELGSQYWAYTSFGAKIRRAIELKRRGGPVRIVSERDFWEAAGNDREENTPL